MNHHHQFRSIVAQHLPSGSGQALLVSTIKGLPISLGGSVLVAIASLSHPSSALAQSSQQLRTTCVGVEPLSGQSSQGTCCSQQQQAQCFSWKQVLQPQQAHSLTLTVPPQLSEKQPRLSNPQDVNTVFSVGTPNALYQNHPKAEHDLARDRTTQMAIQAGLGVILPPVERFAEHNSPGLVKLVRNAYAGYNSVFGPREISPNITIQPKLRLETDAFRVGAEFKISDL